MCIPTLNYKFHEATTRTELQHYRKPELENGLLNLILPEHWWKLLPSEVFLTLHQASVGATVFDDPGAYHTY